MESVYYRIACAEERIVTLENQMKVLIEQSLETSEKILQLANNIRAVVELTERLTTIIGSEIASNAT